MPALYGPLATALALVIGAVPAAADAGAAGQPKTGSNVAEWLGDTVPPLTVGLPVALYVFGDRADRNAARRVANAGALAQLVVKALKSATDEPRPRDPTATDGFPSGHAAAAWAMATVLADRYRRWRWWAYGWAGAVTWSRRGARHHTWAQALAGAFIGWGAARLELSSSRGLFLHVTPDAPPAPALSSIPASPPDLTVTLWSVRF